MQGVNVSRFGEVLIMLAAAVLEIGGDALIRKGLRGSGILLLVLGVLVLGAYGVVVNVLRLDFSRLLGAYVGFFAIVSVAAGRFLFQESVANTTWLGLGVVLAGSLIIQFGDAWR